MKQRFGHIAIFLISKFINMLPLLPFENAVKQKGISKYKFKKEREIAKNKTILGGFKGFRIPF